MVTHDSLGTILLSGRLKQLASTQTIVCGVWKAGGMGVYVRDTSPSAFAHTPPCTQVQSTFGMYMHLQVLLLNKEKRKEFAGLILWFKNSEFLKI